MRRQYICSALRATATAKVRASYHRQGGGGVRCARALHRHQDFELVIFATPRNKTTTARAVMEIETRFILRERIRQEIEIRIKKRYKSLFVS
jgi:fructose-1-phosphate kinase PfkB-like protein